MTSTKTIAPRQEQKPNTSNTSTSPEVTMHKLKLEWIMARDESERKRVSIEIRRQLGVGQQKS